MCKRPIICRTGVVTTDHRPLVITIYPPHQRSYEETVYKTVKHVKLRRITRNKSLDNLCQFTLRKSFVQSANKLLVIIYFRHTESLNTTVLRNNRATRLTITNTLQTRSSAIADKPRVLVCKVVEVWQDFLSEYVDKKFTYICYRRLIRHE